MCEITKPKSIIRGRVLEELEVTEESSAGYTCYHRAAVLWAPSFLICFAEGEQMPFLEPESDLT